jgi:adenylate cyclase
MGQMRAMEGPIAARSQGMGNTMNYEVLPVIGAHYGEVFAGALGNTQLLEFTVIGDTVNVAERLERLSRNVDSPLVVSAALLGEVSDADRIAEWRHLPLRELKGHRQPVESYCFVARRNVGP